jgi:large subunit ribosomal protein L1
MQQLKQLQEVQEVWVLKWRANKMNLSKRMKSLSEIVDRDKFYEVNAGLELVKKTAKAKFDESIDAAIKLGIDPKKSDQLVRGALVLPSGTGKSTRVAVFAQGDAAEDAKKAGADLVGFEDLADQIKKGVMDFDVLIATPDAMKIVGTLRPSSRSKRIDAKPQSRNCNSPTRKSCRKCESGTGSIQN